MSSRSRSRRIPPPPHSFAPGMGAVPGLPKVNYYLPIGVTLLAAVVVFVVLALVTILMLFNAITQWGLAGRSPTQGSGVTAVACGLLFIVGIVATAYFFLAVVKGVRDIWAPIYYTRGSLADKRVTSGRMVGNWLAVTARYSGPDLQVASQIDDDQRAASTDRSQILQPRFTSTATGKAAGYLPEGRISASATGGRAEHRSAREHQAQEMASTFARSLVPDEAEEPESHRVVFRVEAAPHANIETGDEVLVAHSRFLQHIFYVARLKGGEWESFPNKTLI